VNLIGETSVRGLQVQIADDGPVDRVVEFELELVLDRDGVPELRDELLERDCDRCAAELERGQLLQVTSPHALLGVFLFEGFAPAVAVAVDDLLDAEVLALSEQPVVVEGQRLVDAGAEEHRAARRLTLTEQIPTPPSIRADCEQAD
jgi:hypothetical protein